MEATPTPGPGAAVPAESRRDREWRVPLLPRRGSGTRWAFDLLFAVLLPPVLIHLDNAWNPIGTGGIRLLPFRPYTPVLAHGAIGVLLGWWILRGRVAWIGAFAAGPLLAGAAFALGTGILLIPLSLFGILLSGVGVLGFVPLLTGLAFADAGLEALASARPRFGAAPALAVALCAALLFGGACAGAGRVVRIVEIRETAVLAGERPGSPARAESLLWILRRFPGIGLDPLERAARRAGNRDPRDLAEAYERIAGRPLPDSD